MESLAKLWNRLETGLAALLIGLALIHAGQTMGGMLTTSLSTDEFGTIGTFSSKGPVRVLTDYRAPKNHILFNLANSLLPGRDSFHPARARALAILATVLTAGCIIAYATYRRQLVEGAVLLALWSTAPNLLDLSMEARGYGFLGLFAIAGSIATVEFLRFRNPAWLWIVSVSTVLGAHTIPAYLFFAAPLMLLTFAVDRTRRTLLFGAGAAAAITLLYLPVLGQVITALRTFHEAAENDFRTPAGILHSLKLHLLSCDDWEGWLFLATMTVAPFVLPAPDDSGGRNGRRVVVAACATFFAILLALQSPPVRISAFVFAPLALAGILSIGAWMRIWPLPARALPFAALCAILIVGVSREILWSRFLPAEDWLQAGRAVDSAFPERMKVDFQRYAKYLKHTLADSSARNADFNASDFAAGQLIVADAGNKWAEGRRFAAPDDSQRVMEWIVPGRIRDVVLSFTLPADWSINESSPIADGDFSTGQKIAPDHDAVFSVQIPKSAKALVLLLNRPIVHRDLLVQMTTGEEKQDLTQGVLLAGNGIILPAGDLAGTKVDIRLATIQPDLELREAWISR